VSPSARNAAGVTGDGSSVAQSHAGWLRARSPAAPAALVVRIGALFAAHSEWDALPTAEAFIAASEELLRRVLHGDAMERACAVDLLAADACVTYAFEAAADEPNRIGERAARAMARIATLASEFGASR
jgi:hypothetical protein